MKLKKAKTAAIEMDAWAWLLIGAVGLIVIIMFIIYVNGNLNDESDSILNIFRIFK